MDALCSTRSKRNWWWIWWRWWWWLRRGGGGEGGLASFSEIVVFHGVSWLVTYLVYLFSYLVTVHWTRLNVGSYLRLVTCNGLVIHVSLDAAGGRLNCLLNGDFNLPLLLYTFLSANACLMNLTFVNPCIVI
jgi:hypothetical protein